MLKDITLGQFFPGESFVHRLDPRTKLLMVIIYIVALFMASNWLGYGLVIAFLAVSIKISTIPLKSITKGLKPVMMIVVFTGVLNLFFTPGTHEIVNIFGFSLTWEAVERAAQMILRIMLLITGTFLLTYTTSPIALTDGLENLLNPLKVIKFPVHELSMMMCIALRFIPTLIEETDKIMSAQKARGADFESGNLLQRAKALVPVLVPLFISAFRRADDLACAMECRLYHGGANRTRLHSLKYGRIDALGGLCALVVCGAAIIFNVIL